MGSIHGLEIDQSFPLESTILPQQIPALSKKDKKTSRATPSQFFPLYQKDTS